MLTKWYTYLKDDEKETCEDPKMFSKSRSKTVDKQKGKYISFPDVIQSQEDPDTYFLVYREGDRHHPSWSNLVLQKSTNRGSTWKVKKRFRSNFSSEGRVWNCPRFAYINNELVIICDTKTSTREATCEWKTYIMEDLDSMYSSKRLIAFPGMLPDRVVPFKGNLFCANHRHMIHNGRWLIQLINWSRDNGRTWYDSNILAVGEDQKFCEASVVNIEDKYLLAYLRDNSGHIKNIYTTTSKDGVKWTKPKPLKKIWGQRPTANYVDGKVYCAYRDTNTCGIGIFEHDLDSNETRSFVVDKEYRDNQYHCGYTGLAPMGNGEFLVAYYIKKTSYSPHIKTAKLTLK